MIHRDSLYVFECLRHPVTVMKEMGWLQEEHRCFVPSQDKVTDSICRPLVFRYSSQQLLDYVLHHHVVEVPENPESHDLEEIRGDFLVSSVTSCSKAWIGLA